MVEKYCSTEAHGCKNVAKWLLPGTIKIFSAGFGLGLGISMQGPLLFRAVERTWQKFDEILYDIVSTSIIGVIP